MRRRGRWNVIERLSYAYTQTKSVERNINENGEFEEMETNQSKNN